MPDHEDSLGGETLSGEEQQDPAEQSLGDGATMGGDTAAHSLGLGLGTSESDASESDASESDATKERGWAKLVYGVAPIIVLSYAIWFPEDVGCLFFFVFIVSLMFAFHWVVPHEEPDTPESDASEPDAPESDAAKNHRWAYFCCSVAPLIVVSVAIWVALDKWPEPDVWEYSLYFVLAFAVSFLIALVGLYGFLNRKRDSPGNQGNEKTPGGGCWRLIVLIAIPPLLRIYYQDEPPPPSPVNEHTSRLPADFWDGLTEPVPSDPPVVELPSITNTLGMKLNEIPTGAFTMGSPESEAGREDDETQHKVTISKPFYMQTTEVTQGQWKSVMGTEPWKGKQLVKEGPNYPAVYVSWDDAVAYCKKLSDAEGKTYRLPTEAEWEYACRAGTETAWSFGDDEKVLGDYAWYDAWLEFLFKQLEQQSTFGENYPHQVGLKKPNAFGLYDMHGNVEEWCHDYYGADYYKQSPEKDPTGPASGSFRVLRGGSWSLNTRDTRSARRDRYDADYRYHNYGFRLVRELD